MCSQTCLVHRQPLWVLLLLTMSAALGGCDISPTVEDPVTTLNSPSLTGAQHTKALELLAETPADDEQANRALERAIGNEGYTLPIREQALDLLARRNLAQAQRTLRLTLPNAKAWAWVERACQIIAERGWTELTPALISSWGRPVIFQQDDDQRPEYLALVQLYGHDQVIDVVFDLFVKSRSVGEQGLRTRCWDLLYRLGQRERLQALLNSAEVPADDVMLLDLQAASRDFGLLPHNREEILWLRKLRQPDHGDFWARAARVCQTLPADRRGELEIRDLPILVSASLHDPDLLAQSPEQLYERVEAFVTRQKHHTQESNFEGFAGGMGERLGAVRQQLTWGDMAAMLIAIRAMQVAEVRAHLFDYAQRDRDDPTTEYGGVIALDEQNRFEILEFPPVIREHDQKFIASQEMLNAAYVGIFHFHLHVQKVKNDRFAGPGFGDSNYADNTRANCLVFTSINQDTLNVDYYRYGRVVVDLGEIKRQ
jgi:hypothetical protein